VRIERILKRARHEILGKVRKEKKKCILEPLDKNTHLTFELSKKTCSELREGTIVVAKITHFPNKETPPRAKVKEVVGHPEDRFLAIDLLIRTVQP